MSRKAIVERILSDADAECAEILANAQMQAEKIAAEAEKRAAEERAETEAELAELTRHILEVNAATARLDSAKLLLAEKRRVIETVYARALEKLLALGEAESVKLLSKLLAENAEEGDEIVFDENFKYRGAVSNLPVIAQKRLTLSAQSAKLGGGILLRGKRCDKDLSYPALLKADMEENQSALAASLFATTNL